LEWRQNTVIDRCCGKDPRGTLYLGLAGGRGRNWSILRTCIMHSRRESIMQRTNGRSGW
jgi:hypothetical protein